MIIDEKEKTEQFEKEIGSIERCYYLLRLYKENQKNFRAKAKQEGFTDKQIKLFYQLQG